MEIPEWIAKVTPTIQNGDPVLTSDQINQLISQINFLKGAYYGHLYAIQEMEEKLALAFDYQKEIDARLAEESATLARQSATVEQVKGEWKETETYRYEYPGPIGTIIREGKVRE